ncbi:Arm DNA-binding domain-containing protein [Solibacillus silvestris]
MHFRGDYLAYFRKRGDVWEYRIKYNDLGKQKTLSKSGFATKSAARAAAVLVEEKLFKGVSMNSEKETYYLKIGCKNLN